MKVNKTFYLEVDLAVELEKLAQQLNKSQNEIVNTALEQYLRKLTARREPIPAK